MNRKSSTSAGGGRKKVKPISFGGDEDEEEIEDIVMAEVVTAVPVGGGGAEMKKKMKIYKQSNAHDSGDDEEEDQYEGEGGDSITKFMQKSPSRRKSKLTAGQAPPAPMTSREPSFLQSTTFQPAKPWPPALKKKVMAAIKLKPNESAGREFLARHSWPSGLKDALIKSVRKLPIRFFIVDDSGSMILNDGRRLVASGNNARLVKCTRWAELSESLLFMAELSEKLNIPSEFRLLNGADPIVVGLGDDEGESLSFLKEVMAESPAGPTPLCTHITAVVESIGSMEKELRASGQKAVVVIATDGESSDGNVAEALRPLTNLPVLVILRLCTEEKEVIQYWNSIDNQLELDIDVIDDQLGDAKQVNDVNGWLVYGEPIHRLREFGATMKEMDIIDESTMSSEQMRMICAYLFCSGDISQIPHPGVDWKGFIAKLKEFMAKEPKIFCPITQTLKPWVDIPKLSKFYVAESSSSSAGGGCAIS